MKMKILIGVLVFLIVVNLATLGSYLYFRWQMPAPGAPPFGPNANIRPLIEQLTPDQREKLFDMIRQYHDETRDPAGQVRDLEQKTFDMLHRDPVPHDSVNANLDEIGKIRLEMSKRAAQRLIETKAILSPAQQELFFNAIMHGRGGPPPGRGEGRHPGGPPFRRGPMFERDGRPGPPPEGDLPPERRPGD